MFLIFSIFSFATKKVDIWSRLTAWKRTLLQAKLFRITGLFRRLKIHPNFTENIVLQIPHQWVFRLRQSKLLFQMEAHPDTLWSKVCIVIFILQCWEGIISPSNITASLAGGETASLRVTGIVFRYGIFSSKLNSNALNKRPIESKDFLLGNQAVFF